MTTSHFALCFKLESASSRDRLAKGAQEDPINVIRKDASVQSHITFARILTDMRGRHLQFHKVHHLFLWSSSQEEVLFHEQRCRLAINVVLWCHDNNVVISVENPANSWLWAALVAISRDIRLQLQLL